MKVAAIVLSSVLLLACESGVLGPNEEGRQLRGITTLSSSATQPQRIVFMGRRADLAAELADSLAGKADSERWYRIELPEALMPVQKMARIDLATTPGIRYVFRLPVPQPLVRKNYYRTLDVTSTSGKLTGTLELTPAGPVAAANGITDTGQPLAVATSCVIVQTISLPGLVLKDHRGEFEVGALAEFVRTGVPAPPSVP